MRPKPKTKSELKDMIVEMTKIIAASHVFLSQLQKEGRVSKEVVNEHMQFLNFMLEQSLTKIDTQHTGFPQ